MLRWENLYYAGRLVYGNANYQCQNNPKYEIEGIGSNDKNDNIIYDAWSVGIHQMDTIIPEKFLKTHINDQGQIQFDESDFDELSKYFNKNDDDGFIKLLYKKNKTMNDWYNLLGNPKYTYHSIYESKHAIDDHLLCTNGNGYDWNSDGFLCENGIDNNYGKFYTPMILCYG